MGRALSPPRKKVGFMWHALGVLLGGRWQGQLEIAVNHALFMAWTDDAIR